MSIIMSPMAAAAQALSGITGSGAEMAATSTTASGAAPTPFADLMTDAVSQVNQLQDQAHTAVTGLMSGSGVDVHQAMIAT
jgi:flagellar hook-basal body complex protein FliE